MDEELNQSVDDDDEDEDEVEDQKSGGSSRNEGQQRSTTLEMMKQRVKTEYNKIASTYKTQKAQFVKDILVKNRVKLDDQLSKRFADCQEIAAPFEYASEDQSETSAAAPITHSIKCSARNCATNHSQSINIRLIKSSPALPAMFAWNHVQQNYAVDDEVVLSNIPYLGDDVKDSDVFIDDLLNHYDRGVHGNREEGAGFLNDQMFFDLANRMVAYVPEADQSAAGTSSFNSKIPPDIVFEAIGAIFTDKGTMNDLKAKYRDILYKSSGGTISSSEHCNPDIESPNAVSATAEQTLHSFTTLFCRRCYKYDCYMHPCTLPPSKVRQKPDLKVDGPCGEKCSFWFLDNQDNSDHTDSDNDAKRKRNKQHQSTSQGNSPLRSLSFDEASSNQSSDDCCGNHSKKKGPSSCLAGLTSVRRRRPTRKFNIGQWTPAEESLFRAMATVFGENCCAIATAVDTKTCQEVYAFAAKDRMNNPVSPEKPVTPGDERCFKYKRFRHKDWMRKYSKVAALKQIDGTLKVSTTSSYMPCSHDGYCNEQNCCCIGRSTFCEKFCHCPADCPNRFPGCRCKAHCDTKQCPCYLAVRECDPDLCPSCGAADFNTGEIIRCQNVNIQRGLKKRLLLAPSDVAGWGIFLKEPVEKNTFIAEYCGEIISQDEAERRGKVYDRHMCSFLFNLNQDLVVDATRKGNKIRFANHSVNPNCVAKVLMVNGDHRIGIFSRCAINSDDELFFDYRYGPVEQLKFVGIEQKRKSSMPKT